MSRARSAECARKQMHLAYKVDICCTRRFFRVNCHKMKTARSTTVFMYFVMSATSCCTSLSISNYQFSCNTLEMRDFFLCNTLVMRDFFRYLEETCPTPGPTLVSMWIVNHWIVNQTTTVSVILSITNLKSNGIGYMIILNTVNRGLMHMQSKFGVWATVGVGRHVNWTCHKVRIKQQLSVYYCLLRT